MLDVNDYNLDAYWIVDNKKYFRKIDAMLASTNNNVEFYYYNKEFNDFDWTVEPIESFKELAKQRAQQLRDNNKYLRLWYSGGADSHTVLQTFLTNNIYLDEIVMVRASPIDDFGTNANRETNLRSLPYINSIRHDIPNTKISLVDITASQYLEHYKTEDWAMDIMNLDFSDDLGNLLCSRRNLEKYGKLKVRPGTVEITGGDKPKIIRHDGKYYITMVDSSFQYLHVVNLKDFYTTPEFPALHAKQCYELKHILDHWFSADKNITHNIYNPELMDPVFKTVWYNCCRQIINPEVDFGKGWQLITPKGQSRLTDAIAFNSEIVKHYYESLKELQPMVSDYWKTLNGAITGIANLYCMTKETNND